MTEQMLGKIGFVGAGNMAEAFIKGLIGSGIATQDLTFFEPDEQRRSLVRERYQVKDASDNQVLVCTSDVVVLAVKPQVLDKVLAEVKPAFNDDKLLISILAGATTARLEAGLGGHARVVRAMPNTPALVGQGATALSLGKNASSQDRDVAQRLFESVGMALWVAEDQMDAVTGLSGSGPAFVYSFIEALTSAGSEAGLPWDISQQLVLQTVIGAAHMVRQTGEHPMTLREKVCSPGGTTICGVEVLEKRELREVVMNAVAAATRRSRELGHAKK